MTLRTFSNGGVRIIGGPWPERIGCEGVIVPAPAVAVAPWHGMGPDDVIVLLDDDPVGGECFGIPPDRAWTCRIRRSMVEVVG